MRQPLVILPRVAPAPSFSFVHAADLHLDTPFKGIGEVAPDVARSLREASLDAFDAIVELVLERGAAFLLVAGDVYDGAERGLRAQLRFRDGLERLSDAGVASFVVHGNHDPVASGWSAIERWPDLVTIFGTGSPEAVPVRRDGELLATVQGVSYAQRATTENLALRLRRPEGPGLHVGLLHCNVEGAATGYADYSPCTLDDLRRTRLDYLALGHVHQRRVLAGGPGTGDPWVVYPGNSQARSPRASELEPKGAVIGHVVNGEVTEVEFVACDSVRFGLVEVDVSSAADLAVVEERLAEAARSRFEDADGRSLVLRGRLVGRGALHQELGRPGVLSDLLSSLREETGR
ncbi:MAG: phosphoesterase, partial [Acidimicrobiaceae bacterium]|nr:phosphoesterase [Acidimicrobiaceae bacterium]